MRIVSAWLAALCLAASFGSAQAGTDTQGTVLWTGGCGGRYIVETAQGQSLMEWYGGIEPKKGDVLFGDLDTPGFREVKITSRSVKTTAYIDVTLSTAAAVTDKLHKRCPYMP
jgi:hypothetical protein